MSRIDYKGLGKSARKKAKAGILPPGGRVAVGGAWPGASGAT